MISLAEDVRDIAGWPAIEWRMTEEEVREALAGRLSPITPIAKFANSYAPFKLVRSVQGIGDDRGLPVRGGPPVLARHR